LAGVARPLWIFVVALLPRKANRYSDGSLTDATNSAYANLRFAQNHFSVDSARTSGSRHVDKGKGQPRFTDQVLGGKLYGKDVCVNLASIRPGYFS